MAITTDQLEALSKQVFITDYLLNGLFPCQSDIVRLIRSKKRAWDFNDKFEYRMLLANTNTGGSLNSQVYKDTIGLRKPGDLEYGTYHATNKGVCSRFEFASEILRLTGKQVEMKPVVTHMSDFSRERPAFSVLDNFIMTMTPVYDFPDWKESLKEYMEERGLLNEK